MVAEWLLGVSLVLGGFHFTLHKAGAASCAPKRSEFLSAPQAAFFWEVFVGYHPVHCTQSPHSPFHCTQSPPRSPSSRFLVCGASYLSLKTNVLGVAVMGTMRGP